MQDIKFRVWNGEQMVSPDYIDRMGHAHWKEDSIPTSSNEVEQYTGLKDKNGKDICEGDILRYNYHVAEYDNDSTDFYGEVIRDNRILNIGHESDETLMVGFILRAIDRGEYWYAVMPHIKDVEIIGNVHENPELLK